MANFSDLANELIIEVWHYILDPEAVENFALTCKTIYSLGRPFIHEHNELKAKFSSITHSYKDTDTGKGPAKTLETLLLNPRAALYVRNASIDSWRSCWGEMYDSRLPSYSEETMELFRQAIESSPFLGGSSVHRWIEEIEEGNEDTIYALIVMRLPHLKSFTLLSSERYEYRLYDTIDLISQSRDTEALSRLEEVRLGQECPVWRYPFSALPSVKKIWYESTVGGSL